MIISLWKPVEMKRFVAVIVAGGLLAACGRGATDSALPSESSVAPPTTTTSPTSAAPTTDVSADTGEPAVPFNPFTSTDPDLRTCLIDIFGPSLYQELQTRLPDPSEEAAMETCMVRSDIGQPDQPQASPRPKLDTTSPLPESPPRGTLTAELGPVTLTTFDPITITSLENSTNIYVTATNTGLQPVTVQGPRGWEVDLAMIRGGLAGPQHFFDLHPKSADLAPGESRVFEFMTTSGAPETEMTFPFRLVETGDEATLTVRVVAEGGVSATELMPRTSRIQGTVTTPDGQPVPNAQVSALPLRNLALDFWRSGVNGDGLYSIDLPSTEDLRALLGDRPLPYDSLAYAVHVDAAGYTASNAEVVEIGRGETKTVDLVLDSVEPRDYELVGETNTGGAHGTWWLLPLPGFEAVVATQGRHPPELDEPGHIVLVNTAGEESWRFDTPRECWGLDVSVRGDFAAGCHDGVVYLLGANGQLRWQFPSGSMNRIVRFDPGGTTLITGPDGSEDVVVLDVESGQRLWTYGPEIKLGWLREAVWSPDGERVLTGHGGGPLVMFTRDGDLLWEVSIGEFPMVLEIDAAYNSYAAGKSRELFGFDADGNLRFRRRISNHVITAGANSMDVAGDRLAVGTVGGVLQFYRSDGELLWQRRLEGNLQGHNALDMTPDGGLIIVGSAGGEGIDGHVSLFDDRGGLLWQTQYNDGRDLGTLSSPYDFDHNHRGVISVAISDDRHYIAAGYGDSSIRIFEHVP